MEDGYSDRFADPDAFLMESSSGSSKRAKAPGNSITQSVLCLVDGCNWDLSHCKEYHRRHKVCELHSKAPKVTIGGREQRFCQQCSRFHSLVEFDEGKRSCRKRLDCHNRRRRKPSSELLSRNTGRFSCDLQGSTLLSFNSPRIIPSAVMGPVSAPFYINQNDDIARSTAQSRGEGNRFQIFMGNEPSLSEVSTCQPLLDSSSSPRNSESSKKMLYDNRALSLLSSAPAETREIGLSHMVQPEPMSLDQSSIQNLHYSGLNQYSFSQGVESNSDFNSNQNVFQNRPDGSSASEPHQQTLSFMWE